MPDWPRYLVVPLITLGGAVKLREGVVEIEARQ